MGIRTAVINVVLELKNIVETPEFIGSRGAGEIIRNKIDSFLNNNIDCVTVDFIGVDEITQSFGDEIVGIYIRAFGTDFIKSKIKINNANQSIRDTLNFVASYSKVKAA